MAQIKYKPSDWSNVIDMLDLIQNWSQMRYEEIEEDGEKYILINLADNDVEEAFHIGTLIGNIENNNNKN